MDAETFLVLEDNGDMDDVLLMEYFGLLTEPRERIPFDLSLINPDDCLSFFRFEKEHLNRLRRALRIPDTLKGSNGTVFTGIEGLCVLLRRLSYPNRLVDISGLFNRPVEEHHRQCDGQLCVRHSS